MRASHWIDPSLADQLVVPPLPVPLPDFVAGGEHEVELYLYHLLLHVHKYEAIVFPSLQGKWQQGNMVKWSYTGGKLDGRVVLQFVYPVDVIHVHFMPGASLAALDLLDR